MSSENNEINSEGMLKDRHIATVVTETTIFGLVTIVSFPGNLLVCYAVYRNPLSLMYSSYFIIAVCYWKIYRKVKMHTANLSWQSSNAADVKVSKTLFVTVVSFVSLLLPAHIILASYKIVGPANIPRFLSLLGILFVFMTSCTNPFIYGYMNRAFRSEFKKCLMLKRGHSVSESTATGQS